MAHDHARSFGTAAQRYDRYRPSYAVDAVAWALGERPVRVADVGAGTGILSRLLQRLGHGVVAVEPDDLMRARLTEVSPGVEALAGTAEDLPLPDGSVDAVVAGQAYHWFDAARAHGEVARVLRPGGEFAVLWNDADPATPWTLRFAEIIDGAGRTGRADAALAVSDGADAALAASDGADVDFGELFAEATRAEFRHEVWLAADDLVALATTRSPYLVAGARERQDLVDAVRRLIAEAGLSGRFAMPHLTHVHRAALG